MLRGATGLFALKGATMNLTDQKRLWTGFVVTGLRSNGSSHDRKPSEFEDSSIDALYNMMFYGIENGLFDSHPSVGFELFAMLFLKKRQATVWQTPL